MTLLDIAFLKTWSVWEIFLMSIIPMLAFIVYVVVHDSMQAAAARRAQAKGGNAPHH